MKSLNGNVFMTCLFIFIGLAFVSYFELDNISNISIFENRGLNLFLFGAILIIYAQNNTIKKSRENENKFRLLFESASDAIYLFELTKDGMPGNFIEVNQIACERFGYSREQMLKMSPVDITSNHRKSKVADIQSNLLKYGKHTFEGEYVNKYGKKIPSEIHVSIIEYKNKKHALAISRDITERKKTADLVYKMAYYDQLTGLPNRRLFEEQLTKAIKKTPQESHNHAVMFIDLDGFKQINDTFGHAIGDCLLQNVAHRLKNIVRGNDFVSRLAGDEFTILLPNISKVDALKVSERIISSFESPFYIGKQRLDVSCSIGITFSSSTINSIETIMRQADLAMYEAKNKGKNTYYFYPDLSNIS